MPVGVGCVFTGWERLLSLFGVTSLTGIQYIDEEPFQHSSTVFADSQILFSLPLGDGERFKLLHEWKSSDSTE